MKTNNLLILFGVMALAQWAAPLKMILDREDVLSQGKEFRFLIEPIDPNDPFRGKYVFLNFKDDKVKVTEPNHDPWEYNEKVFVTLTTDSAGYAKIKDVLKEEPPSDLDYIPATVNNLYEESGEISVSFPFDRFYMEESKAPEADKIYSRMRADSIQVAYAQVIVKKGRPVLKDVMIDGVSIAQYVQVRQNK